MRNRSNLLILIGAAAFLLGVAVVFLVLSDDDDVGVAVGPRGPQQVLVATDAVPAGTAGSDVAGMVELREVPDGNRADDALTSTASLEGRILTVDLREGQQVRSVHLRRQSALQAGNITVPDGLEAVAVRLGFVPGGGGYVGPGDHVHLYANVTEELPQGQRQTTKLVVRNALVLDVSLEVPPRRASEEDERPTGEAVTYLFALSAADAEKVIYAAENESLYVSLLPGAQETPPTPGRTPDNILQ